METFRPEGGDRGKRGGGVGEKVSGEIKSLTDDCSRTKAGGVSSAGRAGVRLVSLASSGLFYMPDPSRAGPQRGTRCKVLFDVMWTLSFPFKILNCLYFWDIVSLFSLFTVKGLREIKCHVVMSASLC